MSNSTPNLDNLRRKIDQIDSDLHDKVMQRTALIEQVRKAKKLLAQQDFAMRPNREAEVIRGLVKRHKGQLPTAVVIRIWRELINSATSLQGPMSVAVCAPVRSVGYWDIARNHFGSSVPMTLHKSPSVVMGMVNNQQGTIGLFPFPQIGEESPWWTRLADRNGKKSAANVIWRLPFFSSNTGQFEQLEALAVAKLAPEPSGKDATLVMVETHLDVSLARIMEELGKCQFEIQPISVHEQRLQGVRQQLIEFEGLVNATNQAMANFYERMGDGLLRVCILGAYPKALSFIRMENET